VSTGNRLLIRTKLQSLVVDRCKRRLQSLRRIVAITWSRNHPGYDGSEQVVDFLLVVNNTEIRLKGVALLDTGSDLDWISSEFARRFGMVLQNSCKEQIAVSITGEPVYSLGVIEARWHCVDYPCRPRFEVSTFHVVDSPCTDIGIGKETLERTGMYGRKFRLMAPQRCPIPPLPGMSMGYDIFSKSLLECSESERRSPESCRETGEGKPSQGRKRSTESSSSVHFSLRRRGHSKKKRVVSPVAALFKNQ
jgi:hypothetical protein